MKVLVAAVLLIFNSQSQAAIPDPVTWLLHGIGGYVVARVIDSTPAQDIAIASTIGAAKEVYDLNFSVPDFLAWGAGAWFYHHTKDMVRCPVDGTNEYWYQVKYEKKLKECNENFTY